MIDGGMCEECGDALGEEVHHIIALTPQNITDEKITISFDNLKFLCRDCHFQQHADKFKQQFEKKYVLNKNGLWFDENGQPQSQKIYLVYGPPASGKTTYVSQHAYDDDLVVDLDKISFAVNCTGSRKADNLLNVAMAMQEQAYRLIAKGEVDSRQIWIIACLPNKQEREQLISRLKAEPILMETSRDECLARAHADISRTDKELQVKLINKWYEQFTV